VTACPEFLLAVSKFFTKGKPKHLEKPEKLVFDKGAAVADGYCCFVSLLSVKISQPPSCAEQ